MKHNQTQIEQESDVLDYINGHLNPEQKQQFEQQLAQDADLAARLHESQVWQAKLAETAAQHSDLPMPDFNQFEPTLKSRKQRLPMGLSVAAALGVVAILSFQQPVLENNEFETLTDASQISERAKLQIVFAPGVNTAQFIQDYQLDVMHSYDNGNIIDVDLAQNNQQQRQQLLADQRTLLVKQLGETK